MWLILSINIIITIMNIIFMIIIFTKNINSIFTQISSNLTAQEGNRAILVNASCTGGTTQNCAVLNNSKISDWRNLLFLFVTGKQILSSNFLDKNFFISGYAQRIFWYDTSYLYYIDVAYISETMVQIKAVYPSSASLGLIIIGLN